MIKHLPTKRNSGFTLIELLVVIAIISILAGAIYMVINPTQLQRKAKETVLKANVSQVCTALQSCAARYDDYTKCDDYLELGVTEPLDPVDSKYYLFVEDETVVVMEGAYPFSDLTHACSYLCSFDFNNGSSSGLVKNPEKCI